MREMTLGELIDRLHELHNDYHHITRDTPIRMTVSSFGDNLVIRNVMIEYVEIKDYGKEYCTIQLEGEQP